jgi:hypothetical protein
LEATKGVEVGVELALDDAGGVLVCFSMSYDEYPQSLWRHRWGRRGRHCRVSCVQPPMGLIGLSKEGGEGVREAMETKMNKSNSR